MKRRERTVELVIAEYERQHDCPPKELFIHASSNFGDEEWTGFENGCWNRN